MLNGAYNQTVTYWAEAVLDGFGERTFSSPIALTGRWEARTDLKIDFEGEIKPSKAVAYLQQDVVLGGFLAEGDQTGTADPTTLDTAYIIKTFEKIRSISGNELIRKVML